MVNIQSRLFIKIALVIVLISMIPLLALSFYTARESYRSLKEETFNHLESIASIQESRMNDLFDSFKIKVALITSRTKLRNDLSSFLENPEPELQESMGRIITDARSSDTSIVDIYIYDPNGYIVASTDTQNIGSYCLHEQCITEGLLGNDIRGFSKSDSGAISVHLSGPLLLNGEMIGVAVIDIVTDDIYNMISDYSGLQDTGETLFALRNINGDALFIHPLRFDENAALERTVPKESTELPITQALLKREVFIDEAIDYRGIPVLAAIRYIEETDWGMVVKIDEAEAFASFTRLRNILITVNILVIIAIVSLTLFWARKLSKPITDLTDTVLRFGAGDASVRSSVHSNDEIGILADSFNQMIENISQYQTDLEKRVRERTVQLQKEIDERITIEKALRESEENFRRSIEDSPLGIRIVSDDGKLLFVNQKILEIYGYASLKEMDSVPAEQRYTQNSYLDHEERKLARKAGTSTPESYQIEILRKDGETRTIEVLRKQILWNGAYQFLSIWQDISERKAAEEREKQLQQNLIVQSRLATVGEMAAGIAHEINNPLTGVVGYASLLLEKTLPEEVRKDIEVINEGAQRVSSIVRRMLAFARHQDPEPVLTDINEIIEASIEIRSHEMELNNITVTHNLSDDLPEILVDRGQIQQVFLNIIMNAEFEMKEENNGGNLDIKTEESDGWVRITFTDNGPGVSEVNLDKLFNPFFTTRTVGKGTGLGLSVSYGIVSQHNGRISVESDFGNGAKFIVELPVANNEASPKESKKAQPVSNSAGKRVLVIDDDQIVREYLSQLLTQSRFHVEVCDNSDTGLTLLREQEFDVVLLDVRMAGMNGIELYEKIRAESKIIADNVIFVTGDVMSIETMNYLTSNELRFVRKPIVADKLLAIISTVIKNQDMT